MQINRQPHPHIWEMVCQMLKVKLPHVENDTYLDCVPVLYGKIWFPQCLVFIIIQHLVLMYAGKDK